MLFNSVVVTNWPRLQHCVVMICFVCVVARFFCLRQIALCLLGLFFRMSICCFDQNGCFVAIVCFVYFHSIFVVLQVAFCWSLSWRQIWHELGSAGFCFDIVKHVHLLPMFLSSDVMGAYSGTAVVPDNCQG